MERIIIKEKAVNYKVMGLLLFYLFLFTFKCPDQEH